MTNHINKLLATNAQIIIVAGEGEQGTATEYTGKRTIRALKSRLTKERCNGDRWSRAKIYSHDNGYGPVYVEV